MPVTTAFVTIGVRSVDVFAVEPFRSDPLRYVTTSRSCGTEPWRLQTDKGRNSKPATSQSRWGFPARSATCGSRRPVTRCSRPALLVKAEGPAPGQLESNPPEHPPCAAPPPPPPDPPPMSCTSPLSAFPSPHSVQTTVNHYTTLKHEAAPVHFAIELVSCQLTGDSLDLNGDCFVSASRAESALRGQDVAARGAGACRQAARHPCGARSQPRTGGYELAGVPAA